MAGPSAGGQAVGVDRIGPPAGASRDPALDRRLLGVGEEGLRRHLTGFDLLPEQAFPGFAGNDRRTARPAREGRARAARDRACPWRRARMAIQTSPNQDGRNPGVEVSRRSTPICRDAQAPRPTMAAKPPRARVMPDLMKDAGRRNPLIGRTTAGDCRWCLTFVVHSEPSLSCSRFGADLQAGRAASCSEQTRRSRTSRQSGTRRPGDGSGRARARMQRRSDDARPTGATGRDAPD